MPLLGVAGGEDREHVGKRVAKLADQILATEYLIHSPADPARDEQHLSAGDHAVGASLGPLPVGEASACRLPYGPRGPVRPGDAAPPERRMGSLWRLNCTLMHAKDVQADVVPGGGP